MCIRIYVYVCMYRYISISISISLYIYICVYTSATVRLHDGVTKATGLPLNYLHLNNLPTNGLPLVLEAS